MIMDISDIIQNLGGLSAMVLLPIWRTINELRRGQEKTNVILARDYVAKNECKHRHELLHADIARVHDRVDEIL
ncbi:MAG: hypothetical protein AB7F25_13535 [Deferribacterales bacterium]